MENKDLSTILDPAIIDLKVEGSTKDEVLRNLAGTLLKNGYIDNVDQFVSDIYDREAEGPTGMGEGISIPHGHSPAARKLIYDCDRAWSELPIRWESELSDDGWQETRLIFLFCVMVDGSFVENHQLLLSQLAMKLGTEARVVKLGQCETVQEIIDTILCDDSELEAVEAKEEIVDLDLDF